MLRSPLSPTFPHELRPFPPSPYPHSCDYSSHPLLDVLAASHTALASSLDPLDSLDPYVPRVPCPSPVPRLLLASSTGYHGYKRPVDVDPVFQRGSKRAKPGCAVPSQVASPTATTTPTPSPLPPPPHQHQPSPSPSPSPSASLPYSPSLVTVTDTDSLLESTTTLWHAPASSLSPAHGARAVRPSSRQANSSYPSTQPHFQDMVVGPIDTSDHGVTNRSVSLDSDDRVVSFGSRDVSPSPSAINTISIRDDQPTHNSALSSSPPSAAAFSTTPVLSSPNLSSESSSGSHQYTPEDEVVADPIEGTSSLSPNMPPSPSSLASLASPRSTLSSSSRNSSPPTLPPVLHLKRSNPKRLALALPIQTSSTSSPSTVTPSTVCPSPGSSETELSSKFSSPFTPGPPKTPALAMSMGRAAGKALKRPSLLSLITSPSSDTVPPTPGGFASSSHPYATMRISRGRGRARSSTSAETYRADVERTTRSAYPLGGTFTSIDERAFPSLGFDGPPSAPSLAPAPVMFEGTSTILASPSTSSTSLSSSASPPSPQRRRASNTMTDTDIDLEPLTMGAYSDGPIEIVPGVWLGAEDSVWRWDVWAARASVVGVMNVAQEIDDPFASSSQPLASSSTGKIALASYAADAQRPQVDYAHLSWSHGEGGLAELTDAARLSQLTDAVPEAKEQWKFWDAIRWLEARRRAGVPVLIHCQCGVSRSATMVIAYLMALAASGAIPHQLGHLASMQDTYDFVKACSPRIGPNVALVYQLVEFARNLTTLLSAHPLDPRGPSAWPALADVETEDEWAARRREFDDEVASPGGAGDEARALDVAMIERAKALA